uniref:Uncharacterized protein n=1 Tax=Bionectria ochroleuca TaxID=29856 RepID=A0A8H7NNN3_BIOOC
MLRNWNLVPTLKGFPRPTLVPTLSSSLLSFSRMFLSTASPEHRAGRSASEHWPPTKPAKGETGPTIPDHRNAISVSGGYQYQNVLEESDSVKLVKDVGNVVQVFSGDDHDYCQLVHSESQGNVPEITVKSMSMAMGVPTPGFLMVSLYNPVDEDGNRIPGAPETTLQTHLCLLPNQIHTYIKYVAFIILSLVVLILRAVLVPILGLSPFALEKNDIPEFKYSNTLPISTKDKVEPPIYGHLRWGHRPHPCGMEQAIPPSRPTGDGSLPRKANVGGRTVRGSISTRHSTTRGRQRSGAARHWALLARRSGPLSGESRG